MTTMRRIAFATAAIASLALAASCMMPLAMPSDKPLTITVKGDSFVTSWEKPAQLSTAAPEDQISGYSVYARAVGSEGWTLIGKTSSYADSSLRIDGNMLSAGRYELAVCSISGSGLSSDLHSSRDKDADPSSGWVLDWIPE